MYSHFKFVFFKCLIYCWSNMMFLACQPWTNSSLIWSIRMCSHLNVRITLFPKLFGIVFLKCAFQDKLPILFWLHINSFLGKHIWKILQQLFLKLGGTIAERESTRSVFFVAVSYCRWRCWWVVFDFPMKIRSEEFSLIPPKFLYLPLRHFFNLADHEVSQVLEARLKLNPVA